MGSQLGVVLGAVLLIGLPELFRDLQQFRMLAFGAAMVLIMSVNPGFRRDGNNRILLSLPLVTMHEDGDADCRKTGEQPVAGDVRRPFADLRNPSSRG